IRYVHRLYQRIAATGDGIEGDEREVARAREIPLHIHLVGTLSIYDRAAGGGPDKGIAGRYRGYISFYRRHTNKRIARHEFGGLAIYQRRHRNIEATGYGIGEDTARRTVLAGLRRAAAATGTTRNTKRTQYIQPVMHD